jgi:endonuclease/exonuclease/phosphatase family metal-dependent hydrolase
MAYSIVFGNCAGAARSEECSPFQLGKDLRNILTSDPDAFGEIVSIGLSEVIISTANMARCPWPEPQTLSMPLKTIDTLHDLKEFFKGYQSIGPETSAVETLYLSHLNSKDHNHPKAVAGKWNGANSSQRFVRQFHAGNDIYQGTGAILFKFADSQLNMQLRPAGSDPDFKAKHDDPTLYHGNRDSEPRSALVIKGFKITDGLIVDIVFCQLETHSSDKRVAAKAELEKSKGSRHRIIQIDRLCATLGIPQGKCQRPVILMGDFNTRYKQIELDHLSNYYGFQHILPQGMEDYQELNLGKSEEQMGLPFSHLKHRILIDHAFVKGLDFQKWQCQSHIIPLPDEDEGTRITDHRPVVLTINARD